MNASTPNRYRLKASVMASAVVALGFAAFWMISHGPEPENLGEIEIGFAPLYISGGCLLRVGSSKSGQTIELRSVRDRKYKAAVEEDGRIGRIDPNSNSLNVSPEQNSVQYAVTEVYKPEAPPAPVPGLTRQPYQEFKNLGEYLYSSPPAPLPTLAHRFVEPNYGRSYLPTLIRTASLAGGRPTTLCSVRASVLTAPGFAAWTIPVQNSVRTLVTSGKAQWNEVEGREDIVIMSLRTMKRQVVRSERPVSNFRVSESGVVWTTVRPYPDSMIDVHFARATDGKTFSVGEIAHGQYPQPVVEYQGRLYWVQPDTGAERGGGALLSSDLTNGAIKPVLPTLQVRCRPISTDISGTSLYRYRDGLYCVTAMIDERISDKGRRPRERNELPNTSSLPGLMPSTLAVCRIRPDRENPLEVVRKLPPSARQFKFDEGYLYFVQASVRRSLLANVTGDDAGGTPIAELFRVPLK